MKDNEYIDLGLKYGGFMEMDKSFLRNRLSNLTTEAEKMLLVTPPASVLNAYFAELYQKRSPEDATNYFFELSKAMNIFSENPNFSLEGQESSENFRFVRLNLSGKSFAFCYRNEAEEAVVFSEFSVKNTADVIFELAQIFPHYVLWTENEQILMKPATFDGEFIDEKSLSDLTEQSENDEFIKLTGYNIEDLLEQAEEIRYIKPLLYQYGHKQFNIYISKGF